jgi:hypothetical protein
MDGLGVTLYLARAAALGDVSAAAQAPAFEVDGDFVTTLPAGRLRLNRMADDGRARHLGGLAGYLETCDIHDRALGQKLAAVADVLGVVAEPTVELRQALPLAQRLVERLGGFLFVRGLVLDAQLVLLARPPEAPAPPRAPPAADRVLARALALVAVARRAFIEDGGGDEQFAELAGLCARADVAGELEPEERAMVEAPRGTLTRRQVIDGTWRTEGLAVLAWSLGLAPLGPLDEPSAPDQLFRAVLAQAGHLEADAAAAAAGPPALRPPGELEALLAQVLAVHWRLVEWRVRPRPVDLVAFVRRASFGPLSLDGVPLVGADLAIAGVAIADAPAEGVRLAASIAVERHRAAAWLCGASPVYSKVSTET